MMPLNLATAPPMDMHKIGPAGETFGELKQRVVDCRQAFLDCPPDSPERDDAAEALSSATSLLRAAYTRVSLPYVAP